MLKVGSQHHIQHRHPDGSVGKIPQDSGSRRWRFDRKHHHLLDYRFFPLPIDNMTSGQGTEHSKSLCNEAWSVIWRGDSCHQRLWPRLRTSVSAFEELSFQTTRNDEQISSERQILEESQLHESGLGICIQICGAWHLRGLRVGGG